MRITAMYPFTAGNFRSRMRQQSHVCRITQHLKRVFRRYRHHKFLEPVAMSMQRSGEFAV
jgi:hypothetical protein